MPLGASALVLAGFAQAQAHDFLDDGTALAFPEELEATLPSAEGSEAPADVLQAVIDQYKLWEAGSTLNVCFFGGEPPARAFFVQTANAWDNPASISFNFGPAPAYRDCDEGSPSHIRVAFENSGNWSYVGTDSLRSGSGKPSLNIGSLAGQPFSLVNQTRVRGTILHELGHALALHHEHQSPESNCQEQINWEVVYAKLGGPPNNFDRAKVDRNMRPLVSSPRLRTTEYDRESIMHYSLPASWFKNGASSSCWVVRNDDLSDTDVAAIAAAYPATLEEQAQYIAQLDIQSAEVVASLDLSAETIQAIQQEVSAALNGALEDRGFGSDFINAPVIQEQISRTDVSTGNIKQNTTGPCSPAIAGVGGNVTTTANCPEGDNVSADRGSVAVGEGVSGSTITVGD